MQTFYLGCAVWAYRGWVGEFFPQGSKPQDFLQLYCDRLTAVEGNTTFYSQPDSRTIDRWRQIMPEQFQFCPKLPRHVSHQGELMPYLPAAVGFMETLLPLGSRLGPGFLQLPPSYGPTQWADLCRFLQAWPRHSYPLALEVRHRGWFQPPMGESLNQLLRDCGVGRVLLDTRPVYDGLGTVADDPQLAAERKKPQLPLQPDTTADFVVVRYVAHPNLERNEEYFQDWVPRLKAWLDQGKTIYFFAHCPKEARSPAVARRVYRLLQQAGANLLPLPWDHIGATLASSTAPHQLSLF